jgi:hypothetical protein
MSAPNPLRVLIRAKLVDGRLPVNSIPRMWGGPGNGESCHACDKIVTKDEFIMEGIAITPGQARCSSTSSASICGTRSDARSSR